MSATSRPSDPAKSTFAVLTVASCGMACLLALLPATGHDQMWLLYAARMVLRGVPLYGPQLFETNPPLIVWLSMVPAALGNLTHLPDTALGKLFTLVLMAFTGGLCLHLLRRLRPALSPATLWALAFVYVSVFAVMPARDLGQRDHFLILFLLPYVFAAAVRAEGLPLPRGLGILIGAMALAGVALKPHQMIVPIAVESALLGFRRARAGGLPLGSLVRPEILAMLVFGVLFLAAIHFFAPLYFSVVLPLARDSYWAYGSLALPQLVLASVQLHILLLLDLALLFTTGWRSSSTLARMLFLAGVGSTVAFYVQGTGWYYQQLPALSLLSLALAFLVLELAERRRLAIPRWAPDAAGALGLLAFVLTAHFTGYPFTDARSFPVDTPDPNFFTFIPAGTAVMTISPTVDDTIQPIFKYHLTLAQRYSSFVMLPAILRAEDPQGKPLPHHIPPDHLAVLDRTQRQDMLEDLAHWQPPVVFVERCQDPAVHCQVLEDRHDNLLAYFLRDPAFAHEWARYEFAGTRGAYDAYTRTARQTP